MERFSRQHEGREVNLPSQDVLDAFRVAGVPVVLPGGEGRSVQVGDVVFKPADPDPESTAWLAETMAAVGEDGFRVARPLRTVSGAWSFGGWTASRHVAGVEPDHRAELRWLDIVAAGRAFHRSLERLSRPGFLDRRSNWWATGDRVAWQEQEPDLLPVFQGPYEVLSVLFGPPPPDRPQLVHGDLTGNVLFAPGLAPAIIDLSPYWRPPSFGEAVVLGDALIWHGAEADLLDQAATHGMRDVVRYVARAIVHRLVTTSERARERHVEHDPDTLAEVERYQRTAELVTDYARG